MSLAIADQRPQQRNGGCVSMFFQLFSKKKPFSKKLLPPVTKPAANKFETEEKMPMAEHKLLLIADENGGGFPKLDSEPDPDLKSTMQSPGVVARLMGLESMPVVNNNKPRKALDSKICNHSTSLGHSRADQELCVDFDNKLRVELRLNKLQKTGVGFLESLPVEALIYGSMKKKKKYPKLEIPVKSPRALSKSSKLRLVQVASKILEPGLQSRGKAKRAITYVSSLEYGKERDSGIFDDDECCKSSGSSVGEDSLAAECGSSASGLSNVSEERKKIKFPVIPNCQNKNGPITIQSKLKETHVPSRLINNRSLSIQGRLRLEGRVHDLMMRNKHYEKPVLTKKNAGTKPCNVKQSECNVKQNEKNLNELNKVKKFVALNKNLNNYTRSRSPTKVVLGSCRAELEKDGCKKNLARKRSSANRNAEAFTNFAKKRSVGSNVLSTKGSVTVSNNGSIVSFTFSSPMRNDPRSTTRRGQSELKRNVCHSKRLISEAKTQKGMALREDTLSNLLDEKIKELSALDRDDMMTSADALQGRSTVSILEELISALTIGAPDLDKHGDNCSDESMRTETKISHDLTSNLEKKFQGKVQPEITAAYLTDVSDQPSPVSILEASFSNDSCSLESLNGSSGSKPQLVLPEMCNNTQSSDMDSDLLDSATSLNITRSLNRTIGTHEFEGSETEPSAGISHAELLFETLSLYGQSFESFILDRLENIINVFSINIENEKERNRQRGFLLDFIMECLDSKFSYLCRCGFSTWLKTPLILNRDRVMREVHVEVREWSGLAGKTLDDLVQNDMKGSQSKWTGCGIKAFEMGVEIQSGILQALIDDMVVDLC